MMMTWFDFCAFLILSTCTKLEADGSKKLSQDDKDFDGDACHGWTCKVSKRIWKEFGERESDKRPYCDIPVIDARNIPASVYENISLRDTPFVLRRGSKLQERFFSKAYLLNEAQRAKLSVKIGHSDNIVRNNGRAPEPIPFKKYVAEMMHVDLYDDIDEETSEQIERPYVFDDFSAMLKIKGTGYEVPRIINTWAEKGLSKLSFNEKSANPLLLIGGSWSGVGFHRHAASVQMMAIGYKRWFFYPPSSSPPGGDHGAWQIFDWYQHVYPNLTGKAKPLECIQKPGDAIWLPELWYHATLNLGDSLAISAQHQSGESKSFQLQASWAQTAPGTGASFLEELLKLEPGNFGAISDLAVDIMSQKPEKALQLLRSVVKADMWALDPLTLMSRILQQKVSMGNAKARKELQRVLKRALPALEKNPRSASAVQLLITYYKLVGNQEAIDKYVKRKQFLIDNGVEEWDFHGALPVSMQSDRDEL